ncbi:MAG: N-acyl homoserine lactonase family protein [Bilifractor sp.]|jgi:glyoxylase-like metal-dependent hydrolase (beta-lactamase superfamily II)
MAKYTIRPFNTGVCTGVKGDKNDPDNFYNYHFSLFKYLEGRKLHSSADEGVLAFLVQGNGMNILVDTGMPDTERSAKYHHGGSIQPEGMAIHEQLKAIGIQPEDIDAVIFTHLHWDHTGHSELFTNAKFYASKKEYDFMLDPIPMYYKSYEAAAIGLDYPAKHLPIQTFEGEQELFPGIVVFDTPGHSPGHIAVEVDTEDGKYILAGDAAFGMYTFEPFPELHYDITPPGRYCDLTDFWYSIRRLRDRACDLDHILLCHEPDMLRRMKETPVFGLKKEDEKE